MRHAEEALQFLGFECAEGRTHAVIAPEWGANVLSLTMWDSRLRWPLPLFESVDPSSIAMAPTSYGMPLLAPTPGRVGKDQSGAFRYRGKLYLVEPSRHGWARSIPWSVARRTSSSLTCVAELEAERKPGLFPFRLRATHEVRIGHGVLASRVLLENIGEHQSPANVGWHPYLHRPDECIVQFPAASYWELSNDSEPTPTGRVLPVTPDLDFRSGRSLQGDQWDHVFTNLGNGAEIACSVRQRVICLTRQGASVRASIVREVLLDEPHEDRMQPIRNIQLYTPPGRRAVSLEPLSCPPDAINLLANGADRGHVVELKPGESASFAIRLHIQAILE